MKWISFTAIITFLVGCSSSGQGHWRSLNRDSAGIAPKVEEINEPIVQVYAARTYGWRGKFAVHCWVAYKLPQDEQYKVAHVIGWRLYRSDTSVAWGEDLPDRYWFGNKPILIEDIRGEKAQTAIPKIEKAIQDYPYAKTYRLWPGPNSNSFIAHIVREVEELTVELPPHAIGKDWLTNARVFDKSQSGTGFQLSILGALGITVGLAEGIELNLLGLSFGIDFLRPALKLPLVGRLGFKDKSL